MTITDRVSTLRTAATIAAVGAAAFAVVLIGGGHTATSGHPAVAGTKVATPTVPVATRTKVAQPTSRVLASRNQGWE
jgi:hypothetical protein